MTAAFGQMAIPILAAWGSMESIIAIKIFQSLYNRPQHPQRKIYKELFVEGIVSAPMSMSEVQGYQAINAKV